MDLIIFIESKISHEYFFVFFGVLRVRWFARFYDKIWISRTQITEWRFQGVLFLKKTEHMILLKNSISIE